MGADVLKCKRAHSLRKRAINVYLFIYLLGSLFSGLKLHIRLPSVEIIITTVKKLNLKIGKMNSKSVPAT